MQEVSGVVHMVSDKTLQARYTVRGHTLRISAGSESVSYNVRVPEGSPGDPGIFIVNGGGYRKQ